MSRKLILLAAGGHGRVVLDALLARGASVYGVVDPAHAVGDAVLGVPVMGGDEWLAGTDPADVVLANGVGVTPGALRRQQVYERWNSLGYGFVGVCHPSAVVARDVDLAPGSQVMAGSVVQTGVRVGANAVVNTGARVDHDCELAPHAFIGPGAVLCGGVRVGAGAFIGAGAVLLPGIVVGAHAVVGAGATVTQDVLPGTRAWGVPATRRN